MKNPIVQDLFTIEHFRNKTFDETVVYQPGAHQLFLLEKARGGLIIDGKKVLFSDNSIIVLSRGQLYSFMPGKVSGYLLQFSDSFWRKTPASANNCKAVLFDTGVVKHRLTLTDDDMAALTPVFEAALKESEGDDYSNRPDVLAAYLKIIVIKIANVHFLLAEDIGNHDNRLYQSFMGLVAEEALTMHDVAGYARRLGVSPRALAEACLPYGTGPKEIINQRLISEARRRLQFSSQSVKEIAGDLHFSTPYQFSAFFKKHMHASPLEYKRQFVKIGI